MMIENKNEILLEAEREIFDLKCQLHDSHTEVELLRSRIDEHGDHYDKVCEYFKNAFDDL